MSHSSASRHGQAVRAGPDFDTDTSSWDLRARATTTDIRSETCPDWLVDVHWASSIPAHFLSISPTRLNWGAATDLSPSAMLTLRSSQLVASAGDSERPRCFERGWLPSEQDQVALINKRTKTKNQLSSIGIVLLRRILLPRYLAHSSCCPSRSSSRLSGTLLI